MNPCRYLSYQRIGRGPGVEVYGGLRRLAPCDPRLTHMQVARSMDRSCGRFTWGSFLYHGRNAASQHCLALGLAGQSLKAIRAGR
jgi:hypothetical protein